MSALADRLRGIVRPASSAPVMPRGESPQGSIVAAAETLEGRCVEAGGQRFVVVDRSYGPGYRHGRTAIMDAMPPWPHLALLGGPDARPRTDQRRETQDQRQEPRLLFLDVETTGLAGGAGTCAFLIGCGWFDGPTFRVRQLFLSAYSAETALLEALRELAQGIAGIVTFNGKSFDLPLIETRYLFHRLSTPFAGVPHVDMLHPARRLWRPDSDEWTSGAAAVRPGCRLSVLERTLCGVAREGDVAGFEIPARYFTYVRSGDARPLAAVFEHNRLDLVSLALLTARASQLLDEGPQAARTAREALGLGRLYERGELCDLARTAYARAAGLDASASRRADARRSDAGSDGTPHRQPLADDDLLTRAEALRSYAVLCRRQRRFADAAAAWQCLIDLRRCPPAIVREATQALAVHHEHRLRDPHAARQFALQSLCLEATVCRRDAVRHRLARLDRKLHARAHIASMDSLFAAELSAAAP